MQKELYQDQVFECALCIYAEILISSSGISVLFYIYIYIYIYVCIYCILCRKSYTRIRYSNVLICIHAEILILSSGISVLFNIYIYIYIYCILCRKSYTRIRYSNVLYMYSRRDPNLKFRYFSVVLYVLYIYAERVIPSSGITVFLYIFMQRS
jgi:hypothetical protein